MALNRRALETLGSTLLGAVLGASVAWIAIDFAPGRAEDATQPRDTTAHLATGSIHAAQLVVDSPRATNGGAASSRFDDPLSVSPTARITPAAAHAGQAAVPAAAQPASDATTVDVESIEGRLRITSNVPGARVTVNGIGWGLTPLTIRYLPPGPKRIRATMDGYRTIERTVELTPDRSDVAVRLELRPI